MLYGFSLFLRVVRGVLGCRVAKTGFLVSFRFSDGGGVVFLKSCLKVRRGILLGGEVVLTV